MTSPRRFLALLGAFFVLPLVLSACGGGGVPGNAVVKIGSDSIKTTEFDHWLKVAATTQAQRPAPPALPPRSRTRPTTPSAWRPRRQRRPSRRRGSPRRPTPRTRRSARPSTSAARPGRAVPDLLPRGSRASPPTLGVKISDADVKKEFDKQRNQSFPKDADYLNFLKTSGYVQEDLLYQIKIRQLRTKLREKILKGSDKVSDAEIADYYNKNKERFAVPEKRDMPHRADQDRGEGQPGQEGPRGRAVLRDGRGELLHRPGHAVPAAASSPRSPRASRRRRWTTRRSRRRRARSSARSRRSSATTSSRSPRSRRARSRRSTSPRPPSSSCWSPRSSRRSSTTSSRSTRRSGRTGPTAARATWSPTARTRRSRRPPPRRRPPRRSRTRPPPTARRHRRLSFGVTPALLVGGRRDMPYWSAGAATCLLHCGSARTAWVAVRRALMAALRLTHSAGTSRRPHRRRRSRSRRPALAPSTSSRAAGRRWRRRGWSAAPGRARSIAAPRGRPALPVRGRHGPRSG